MRNSFWYHDRQKRTQITLQHYKNTEKGFVTRDGYAAVPSTGKKLGIVYEGEILKFCRNEDSANNFIAQHRKTVKKLAQRDAKS